MRKRRGAVGAVVAIVLLFTAAACGDSGDDAKSSNTTTKAKGSLVIGSANFSENVLLANLYAKALEDAGYKTTVRANLGAREVIFPALEKGELDMIPEYLGNVLAFVDKDAPKPGDNVEVTRTKLTDALKAKQLSVLEPSKATDGDVLVVT
jgi:osmoprotectant transport system substrate-binding protein